MTRIIEDPDRHGMPEKLTLANEAVVASDDPLRRCIEHCREHTWVFERTLREPRDDEPKPRT